MLKHRVLAEAFASITAKECECLDSQHQIDGSPLTSVQHATLLSIWFGTRRDGDKCTVGYLKEGMLEVVDERSWWMPETFVAFAATMLKRNITVWEPRQVAPR